MEVPTERSRVQAPNVGRKGGFKEEVTLGLLIKDGEFIEEERGVEQDQQGRKGKGTINTKAHEGKRVSVSLKGRPVCLGTGYAGVGWKVKRHCRSLGRGGGGRERERERVCVCVCVCVCLCVCLCVCDAGRDSVWGRSCRKRVCLCVCVRVHAPHHAGSQYLCLQHARPAHASISRNLRPQKVSQSHFLPLTLHITATATALPADPPAGYPASQAPSQHSAHLRWWSPGCCPAHDQPTSRCSEHVCYSPASGNLAPLPSWLTPIWISSVWKLRVSKHLLKGGGEGC